MPKTSLILDYFLTNARTAFMQLADYNSRNKGRNFPPKIIIPPTGKSSVGC